MQNILHWQKGLFQCSFQLLANDQTVGKLKDSEFTRTAHGQLNHTELVFRSCEGLHSHAEILDPLNRQVIGKIRFNPWYPKATISYGGQTYTWKFSNIWETRWKVYNEAGVNLSFQGWSGKGKVLTNQDQEDALVLISLYISNYYWRMTAIYLACLLPVISIFL